MPPHQILLIAWIAWIQGDVEPWVTVKSVAGHGTVNVSTIDGDTVQGRIVAVDESALVVGEEPFRRVLSRDNVCRITVGSSPRTKRVVLVSALSGVGYFVGVLLGGFSDDPHHQQIAGAVGAALGAFAGSVVPLGPPRVLYQNPGC